MENMMEPKKIKVTEENLIKYAIDAYQDLGNGAYGRYTDDMVELINDSFPLTPNNFESFNRDAKTLRARLGQGIGAASKSAKGDVILFYAKKMSVTPDLSMSVREAQAVIIAAAGRSVAKRNLRGLFGNRDNKEGDGRYSPFFTDLDYKNRVLAHPVVVNLSIKIAEFDDQKPTLSNPEQYKINNALRKFSK
jgi:hypothetical protein